MHDRMVFRDELADLLRVGTATICAYEKDGTIPPRDLPFTSRVGGWRLTTLRAAGFPLPDDPPNLQKPVRKLRVRSAEKGN